MAHPWLQSGIFQELQYTSALTIQREVTGRRIGTEKISGKSWKVSLWGPGMHMKDFKGKVEDLGCRRWGLFKGSGVVL